MDAPTPPTLSQDTASARRVPSWLVLALLLTAGLSLRLWVIARSEVAARDSVGFIRYALRLEREPLPQVFKEGEQPPGYPAVVLLVSWPVRSWRGDTSPETMALSCQLASAFMAVLSIVPTVLLGRELGGRRVGWLAAALILCLPGWLRLTSDGLSEGTYLFWLVTALWLGVRALRKPGVIAFALCGLAAGAAYLTRPEGLEVVVAVGAVLLGRQIITSLRQPWPRAAGQALALGCGLLICLGPYVAVIGRLSNKNTTKYMIGDPDVNQDGVLPQYGHAGGRLLLATWFHESGGLGSRWTWAAKAVTKETAQAFQYVGLGLAIIGVAVFRPRRGAGPALAVLACITGLHALILCRMASLSGYLSERHTLLFVVAGSIPAAAALLWLGDRLRPITSARILTAAAVVAGIAVAAPALAKPMHGNRAGHKAAGLWLADHITANDGILDPFCWAEFYAGRLEWRVTTDRPERLFVVLETSDNQHSRLPHIPDAKAKATLGELVYHWPENRPAEQAQVVVYSVPGDRLPDPARINPRPEYRVGLKAASPTAAGPPTGRGG